MESEKDKSSGISPNKASEEESLPKKGYLQRYVNLCKLISMWPRENTNFFRYYAIFFVVSFSSSFMTKGMYEHMFFYADDLDGVAQVVDYATAYTSGIFRYLYAYFRGKKYVELVNFMNENFAHTSRSPGTKLTMDKYAKVAKYIWYIYFVLTQGWVFQMGFTPIFQYYIYKDMQSENGTLLYPDLELKMALDIPKPFDTSVQPNGAIFVAIHLTGYYSMIFIYTFTDAFWFSSMILATGQFELISHSLRNITNESGENDDNAEEFVAILNWCMTKHSTTREFVHKIEDLMHPIVLVDFLHAVASISFILLDMTLSIYEASLFQVMNLMGYLVVSVLHMYILDYFGNQLTLKEQEISMAIYEIPWYKYPQEMRHKIVVSMSVAGNPFRLTGGKLYTVSLEFFAGTMRTIFSYFMVLLQLREANDRH